MIIFVINFYFVVRFLLFLVEVDILIFIGVGFGLLVFYCVCFSIVFLVGIGRILLFLVIIVIGSVLFFIVLFVIDVEINVFLFV